MQRQRKIVVAVPWHYGCTRNILRGIAAYAQREGWSIRVGEPTPDFVAEMTRWEPDGFIVDPDEPHFLPSLDMLTAPAVIVPDVWNALHFPGVSMDNVAIGRMAAEYFTKRGFRAFAFCSYGDGAWLSKRHQGFCQTLRQAGFESESVHLQSLFGAQMEADLRKWLLAVPKPVAVLAGNDVVGHRVSQICHDVGVHVPDQVAIVGVDNDDVFGQLASPTLSSVDLPWDRMGFEAAQMLDRIIDGEPAPAGPLLLPPTGIVTRQSSDVLAVSDPDLRLALRFIAEHAMEGISVEDVVNATAISRRVLERRFQDALGETPLDKIHSTRLAWARQLLVNSDLSVEQVASRSGFGSGERLRALFRSATDMSPAAYRQKFRLQRSASTDAAA